MVAEESIPPCFACLVGSACVYVRKRRRRYGLEARGYNVLSWFGYAREWRGSAEKAEPLKRIRGGKKTTGEN